MCSRWQKLQWQWWMFSTSFLDPLVLFSDGYGSVVDLAVYWLWWCDSRQKTWSSQELCHKKWGSEYHQLQSCVLEDIQLELLGKHFLLQRLAWFQLANKKWKHDAKTTSMMKRRRVHHIGNLYGRVTAIHRSMLRNKTDRIDITKDAHVTTVTTSQTNCP